MHSFVRLSLPTAAAESEWRVANGTYSVEYLGATAKTRRSALGALQTVLSSLLEGTKKRRVIRS